MSFGGFVLTNDGRNQIAEASSGGEPLSITHVVLGSGVYSGSYRSRKTLVEEEMRLPVGEVTVNEGSVRISVDWTNTDAPRAFYFREIGIIGNNKLCYYDNAGDDAEWIDPESSGVSKQKRIRCLINISGEAQVETVIPSGLYALKSELDEIAEELADTQEELEDTEDLLDESREVIEDNLARAYNSENSYVSSDWCIYEHVLYRCSGATTGDFDPTKWDAVPVGSELKTIKKSVSDGKTLVAGAITEMNVPTAADDTFQEMAENILDILTANPGSVSSSVGLEDKSSGGWSDSFVITALMSFLEGYIASKGTEGTAVVKLVADGRTVIATDSENRKIFAMKSVDNGSVSAAVAVSSGTSATVSITAAMTLSEGYISSKGTEGTKSLSVVNNGANVDVKDGNTVVGRVAKTAGSVTAIVSTTAGTSSSVSVSPSMSLTAGHISSKGTETAKTLTLENNGDSVDLKDGSTVIGRIAKTAGTITVTVGTASNTSNANAVLTPGVTINTAGQHSSSKGTRTVTAKTVSMSNNGANVDLKDGSTVIARIAKTAGSVSSSVSLTSGTGTTITIGTSMSLTAGHISSKGTEGTATVYLVRSGNYVYLSSKSDRGSGNVDYGRYSIPTQTKTASPTTSDVTVSPDSGYLLSGVTAKAPHQLRDYFYAEILSTTNSTFYDDGGNTKTTGTHVYMAYGTAGYTKSNYWIGRPLSDFGDATKAQVVSGKKFTSSAGLKVTGTFEGQTKTSAYPSVNTTRSVSPDSGKYLSGVTVPQFRNATIDPWSMTSGTNTRYSINSGTGSANSGDAMRFQLTGSQALYFNNPFYASETGDFLMLFLAISGRTAGAISIGIHNSTTKPSSVTGFKVYTQLTMNSFTGYILVPCLSSYTAGQINQGGKIWYVPSAWSANDSPQYIHVFGDAAIGVSGAFNGTCNVYGCGARIK